MVGAKQILINIKGNEKDFKHSMTSASTSMKSFAAVTATSSAAVTASMVGMGTSTIAASSGIAAAAVISGKSHNYLNDEVKEAKKVYKKLNAEVASATRTLMRHNQAVAKAKGIYNRQNKILKQSTFANKTFAASQVTTNGIVVASQATTSGAFSLTGNAALAMAGKIKIAAISSLKSMASMAAAAAPLAILVGTIAALGLAFKTAVSGAAIDQETTMKTVALLEAQGTAWNDVSKDVNDYIETLERLTLFSDTELQTSFNEFIVAGMNVEEALKATSAAAALANGTELTLKTSTTMLGKEFATGVSRLKNFGIEAETFDGILKEINETVGDGSHVTETLNGKWKLLKINFTDQLKIVGNDLLPVMHDLLAILTALGPTFPLLTGAIRTILAPISALIYLIKLAGFEFKKMRAWMKGDTDEVYNLKNEINDLSFEYKNLLLNIVGMSDVENVAASKLGNTLKENLDIQLDTVDAVNAEVEARDRLASYSKLERGWMAAGHWISSKGEFVSAKDVGTSGTKLSLAEKQAQHLEKSKEAWESDPESSPIFTGFGGQAVNVNITTGDIVNQGDLQQLSDEITTAVSAGRSGI